MQRTIHSRPRPDENGRYLELIEFESPNVSLDVSQSEAQNSSPLITQSTASNSTLVESSPQVLTQIEYVRISYTCHICVNEENQVRILCKVFFLFN